MAGKFSKETETTKKNPHRNSKTKIMQYLKLKKILSGLKID